MNRTTRLLTALLVVSAISTLLVVVVALVYGYSTDTTIEAGIAFVILLGTTGLLWITRRGASRAAEDAVFRSSLWLGAWLGALWMVEIAYNNFLAPPLPGRDIVDNAFWIVIALAILFFAVVCAYGTNSIRRGLQAGLWAGSVSGLLACGAALLMIVLGMSLLTRDPLNVEEWASLGLLSRAPTMAAYFAFETLSGALGHLVVLGLAMGALLGALGGVIGRGIKALAGRG